MKVTRNLYRGKYINYVINIEKSYLQKENMWDAVATLKRTSFEEK